MSPSIQIVSKINGDKTEHIKHLLTCLYATEVVWPYADTHSPSPVVEMSETFTYLSCLYTSMVFTLCEIICQDQLCNLQIESDFLGSVLMGIYFW